MGQTDGLLFIVQDVQRIGRYLDRCFD